MKSGISCTPYHISIKSTKGYLAASNKEHVACMDESFPHKITARRYAHKEMADSYIVDDYFRVDSFTDVSFSSDKEGSSHKSSIVLNKPSLVKVILTKEIHIFGYSVTIFKVDGATDSLVYTTRNLKKKSAEVDSSDIRASIFLPEGQYSLRIRAIMKSQDFVYRTCDSVKVYVGIMPADQIKDISSPNALTTIPDLGTLLSTNGTVTVKLNPRTPVEATGRNMFIDDVNKLSNYSIKYLGNTDDVGLYFAIRENLDPSMSEEISEITATVFPDLEVVYEGSSFKMTDVPIISTSGGVTFMKIKKLTTNTLYNIEILRHQIMKLSTSKDVPSVLVLNAWLYASDRTNTLTKAKIEVNGKKMSVPVTRWMPACTESVLNRGILKEAISNTISSGIQYEELVVLNEAQLSISTAPIKLNNMKESEGSLLITASPYSNSDENILEEFMITTVTKGNNKQNVRSQEFEGNIYMVQIGLSKANQDHLSVKINYSFAEESTSTSESQCNMIKLSIKFIPGTKQTQDKRCTSLSFESSIKSIIPSLLPDSTLTHDADQIINYEYTSVTSADPKFKINPYKPDQNKIKFTLKKPSSFRVEMISYQCVTTPIERNLVLSSSSKTHNKIMKDTVATGILNFGNSVVIYVPELMPGNYELSIDYGWLKNFKPKEFVTADEMVDFQIEMYSLFQDPVGTKVLHEKDRHIRELETLVRDMSVANFMNRKMGQYLAEGILIPTHPDDKGTTLNIPFRVKSDHSQVMLIASKKFSYIDSIQLIRKDSNSIIKRIDGKTYSSFSEILQSGDYSLQFTYKDDTERDHNSRIQSIDFGISDYENVKKYKECHSTLINK